METKNNCYITYGLIGINVIVFAILEIMGNTESSQFMLDHGATFPSYIYDNNEYWRFFTAMFMHFGIVHLLNNMVVLGCSGKILEEALGHFKFIILYIVGGLGGGIVSYIHMVKSGDYAVSAGASGAIFAIMGALLWIVIINKGRYQALTGKGMLFMIVLTLYMGYTSVGVDNWDHLGGLITGFIFGILLYRKNKTRSHLEFDS